jgi:hypothetical protein
MWPGIIGAAMGAALIWVLWEWRRRAAFMRRVEAYACLGCGMPFEDAIAEYVGPIAAHQRERLDAFRRRFASALVRCGDCDAINLCTDEGRPFAVLDG